MTFEERFEKIEKEYREFKEKAEGQNRNLKKWTVASIALALAALIGGTALSVRTYTAAIEPASITTQSIVLKDSAGKVRATVSSIGNFLSYDVNGKVRAQMSSAGYFALYDSAEKGRARMDSAGYVTAHDSNGVTRVRLNGNDNKIYFYNASGGAVAAHP